MFVLYVYMTWVLDWRSEPARSTRESFPIDAAPVCLFFASTMIYLRPSLLGLTNVVKPGLLLAPKLTDLYRRTSISTYG